MIAAPRLAIPERPALALRRYGPEVFAAAFVIANLATMHFMRGWETLPFHFIYIGLALMYGLRSWPLAATLVTFSAVGVTTGAMTLYATHRGSEDLAELVEVPLMTGLCLAMVFHVERRRRAVETSRSLAAERAEGLERERRFFSRASHELQTPITIVRGHLELLGRHEPPSAQEIASTRDIAVDELQRMERLVGELLLTAKLASGAMERTPIDVADFVRGASAHWMALPQRRWTLRIDAAGTILGDGGSLGRAVESLLDNAYRYTEPGDSIALSTSHRNGVLTISVRDDGCGIPADALPRIFERFYRATTSTAPGVGLGLSIVKSVANAHDGDVTIASGPGEGTQVAILIPGFVPNRPSGQRGNRRPDAAIMP